MDYKLSMSVLNGQLELIMNIDLFIKINTMWYLLVNLELTFPILIIRSLYNQECRKIYHTLRTG